MSGLKKKLEKAWFSVLLFGFICIGVFRVFQDPEKDLGRSGAKRQLKDTITSDAYHRDKQVTKPMDADRRTFALSDHILFFNRVPKSGSEMLVLLLQWLQGLNGFRHVRLRGGEKRRLNLAEQEELVEEIVTREKEEAIPLSFDRHVHFINFTKFDKQSPIYMNLVRDPVDRTISRFYYKRVTPNPNNPDVKRMKLDQKKVPMSKFTSFEECVSHKDPECTFLSGYSYDLAIPYFCGQHHRCTILNDKWAFQRARENVEKYFPVVGVLEELNSTLAVFEAKIPMFFKGVQNMYYHELLEPHRNANRMKPKTTSPFIRSHLKRQLLTEYDFYYWLKARILEQARDAEKATNLVPNHS
ncbi:UNVERIFIED_CONTAM: hypothetical protein PYX00_005247 [Menopon gallinae]|uniref:Heparan sulfate 2-O-sulfotransferase pipe n=1 Tax=Menopon gallinae TaxID=328185 RepID=A0AAW2HQK2_9NEOP